MSIKTNIETVMNRIKEGDGAFGESVRKQAVDAIKGGEGTPEWKQYMSLFATDEIQLARLMPTDETKNVYDMDVARTYLVGNGTCGAATTGYHLIEGVDDKLDEKLPETTSEATVSRTNS